MSLLGRELDVGCTRLGLGRLHGFWQRRAFGQCGRYLGGHGLGLFARQVADDRDHGVARRISLVVEGFELVDGN